MISSITSTLNVSVTSAAQPPNASSDSLAAWMVPARVPTRRATSSVSALRNACHVLYLMADLPTKPIIEIGFALEQDLAQKTISIEAMEWLLAA